MRAKVGQHVEFKRDVWQGSLKVTQYFTGKVECMFSEHAGVERYIILAKLVGNTKPTKMMVSEFQIEAVTGEEAPPEIPKEAIEASWNDTTYLVKAKRGQQLQLL